MVQICITLFSPLHHLFFMDLLTGLVGYFAWMKCEQQWIKQAWVGLYAAAMLILLALVY
jgi:hypothetical protein